MLSLRHTTTPKHQIADEKEINFEKIISDNKRSRYFKDYYLTNIQEIKDFVYSENLSNFILPSALVDIASGLSALLDEYTIKFLDHDIKQYKKSPLYRVDESQLTALGAIEELDKYYASQNDLKTLYPAYDSLLSSLANNYKNKMKLLITRLNTDIDLIHRGFNRSESPSQIKVSQIIQTGSDLHRQGGQVLIIEFSDKTNTKFKVVYKPSSVEADTFITGDMERLSILDEQYINCKSFIELLNPELNSQGKKSLPTYLIIPKRQLNDNNEIVDRYGYIEFIPHTPWQTINCVEHLEKLVKKTAPRDKHEINTKIEQYYNDEFKIMLDAASNDSSCNYILRNENEENDFSFACGCLITIMTTLGIIDMHVENMIVSNKLPVLIDLESSFKTVDASTIENTLAFKTDRGSFSHKSTAPKEYAHLYNITGLQSPTIEIIEKNRSYTIFQIKNNEPIPFALKLNKATYGISTTLSIFKNNIAMFNIWFEDIKRFNICVRYIPVSTSVFFQLRDAFFDGLIKNKQTLQNAIIELQDQLELADVSSNQLGNPNGIVDDSIYHTNVVRRMAIELSEGNIPVYFTSISGTKLYDFANQIIPKMTSNNNVSFGSNMLEEDIKIAEADFFSRPCHHIIHSRFNHIVENIEEEEERLNRELKDTITKLKATDSPLLKININVAKNSNQGHSNRSDDRIARSRCCHIS
jgi:hypothetical protein